MGIQGSGKTELAGYLCKNQFKRPAWYLMHLDDFKKIPTNTVVVTALRRDLPELNMLCRNIIELGKQKKIDCLVIDEMDMFMNTSNDVNNYEHINDLMINHRHYNLAVIGITRRPQDIPTKFFESCEHLFIYALPNSDNVDRKMKALDKNLPQMTGALKKGDYKFIHKQLGEEPKLKAPIPIKKEQKSKGGEQREENNKENLPNNEDRS